MPATNQRQGQSRTKEQKGTVYKSKYCNCPATYVGGTGRNWNTEELQRTVTTKTTLLSTIHEQTTESTGTLLNVFHSVQTTTKELL